MIKYILIITLIINAASCSSEEQEAPTMEETTKMVTNQIKGAMAKAVAKEEPYIHSLSELAESHATVQQWSRELDELEEKTRQGSLTPEEEEHWETLNAKRWYTILHLNRSLNHHIEECKNSSK